MTVPIVSFTIMYMVTFVCNLGSFVLVMDVCNFIQDCVNSIMHYSQWNHEAHLFRWTLVSVSFGGGGNLVFFGGKGMKTSRGSKKTNIN